MSSAILSLLSRTVMVTIRTNCHLRHHNDTSFNTRITPKRLCDKALQEDTHLSFFLSAEIQQQKSRNDRNHNVQKNTRSLTSDDRIHKLILELSELKNGRWDFVTINGTAKRRIVDDNARTLFSSNRQQQSMPRNGNTHSPETNQAQKKVVQHSGPRLKGVSVVKKNFRLQVSSVHFRHTGYGDEHVQNKCRKTNTHTNPHLRTGGDFNGGPSTSTNDPAKPWRLQLEV